MDDFYTRLARELKKSEKDIWVETVLTGEHAGEKRILSGEEDDAGDVAEGGQAVPAGISVQPHHGRAVYFLVIAFQDRHGTAPPSR